MKMQKILLSIALLSTALFSMPAQAANVKLSQIANGSGVNTSTDQCVAVRSGTTDVLVSLGTAAGVNTGTGGATIPLLNANNNWSGVNFFGFDDFALKGSTSGFTILDGAAVASGTWTFPATTDTVVGRATTDTLTNKSINGSTNTLSSIAATSLATVQGNGAKVQLSTGTTTTNDCVKFDANGNTVDAGSACGGGGGGIAIGSAVSGGTATNVLYVDGSINLAQSSNFTFDPSTRVLGIGGKIALVVPTSTVGERIIPATNADAFQVWDHDGDGQMWALDKLAHPYTTVQNAGSTTNQPTIAGGTGAGTSPTISIAGDDVNGIVTLIPGVAPSASATVATITFGTAYGTTPKTVTLTPANAATALLSGVTMVYVDSASLSSSAWLIKSGTTGLVAATTYVWYYQVLG